MYKDSTIVGIIAYCIWIIWKGALEKALRSGGLVGFAYGEVAIFGKRECQMNHEALFFRIAYSSRWILRDCLHCLKLLKVWNWNYFDDGNHKDM